MAAYERAVARLPFFREGAGQGAIAQEVARALATAQLSEIGEAPQRSIAVVQGGTAVAKSAAYLLVGAAIAMARKTRLMVSTSSVAPGRRHAARPWRGSAHNGLVKVNGK